MVEIILISIASYLFAGAFLAGVLSKNGTIQSATLLYMMFLWYFNSCIAAYLITGAAVAGVLSSLDSIDEDNVDHLAGTIVFWPIMLSFAAAEVITEKVKNSVKRKIDD